MNPLLNLEHRFTTTAPKGARADQTKGHRANAGGLRGHSCGDFYPCTIVGSDFGRAWHVLDAITGWKSTELRSQRAAEALAASRVRVQRSAKQHHLEAAS